MSDIDQEVRERGWSDVNRERCGLINKDIAGTITVEEKGRLDPLQAFTDDYLNRVAPRPTGFLAEQLEKLEARPDYVYVDPIDPADIVACYNIRTDLEGKWFNFRPKGLLVNKGFRLAEGTIIFITSEMHYAGHKFARELDAGTVGEVSFRREPAAV